MRTYNGLIKFRTSKVILENNILNLFNNIKNLISF